MACAWKCRFRAVGYLGQILHLEISKWPKIIISLDTRPATVPCWGSTSLIYQHQPQINWLQFQWINLPISNQFTLKLPQVKSVSPTIHSVLAATMAEWFWPQHRLGGQFPSAKFTFYDKPSSFQAQALTPLSRKIAPVSCTCNKKLQWFLTC